MRDPFAIIGIDLPARDRLAGEDLVHARRGIREMRRLQVEIEKMRLLPGFGAAEMAVELAKQDLAVQQERSGPAELKGALFAQPCRIDVDAGAAQADHVGGAPPIFGL